MDEIHRSPRIDQAGFKSRKASRERPDPIPLGCQQDAERSHDKCIAPHWEEFLRGTDEPILAADPEGVCCFANDACAQLLRSDRMVVIGKKLRKVLVATDGRPVQLPFGDKPSAGSISERIRRADDTTVQVEISIHLIRDESEPRGWIIRMRDVEERETRKRMECIGAMANAVAHDLNNVLSPILMGTQILHGSASPESVAMVTEIIEAAAQRGAEILKQVLTCARGSRADYVRVEVNRLIMDAREHAAETFPPRFRFAVELPPKSLSVEGDSAQLRLMVLCMLQILGDREPEVGDVTIHAEEVTIDDGASDGRKNGTYVRFSARPSNKTISTERVAMESANFPTTRRSVRLAMIEAVAKNHSGFFAPEIGTGFPQAYIPAATKRGMEKESREPASIEGRGEKIVVIDHEPGLRKIMGAVLEHAGYKPILAANIAEARELCVSAAKNIPLVIADASSDAAEWIGEFEDSAKPRLIFVTNEAGMRDKRHLMHSGVEGLLMKPYLAQELLRTVSEVLRGDGNNGTPRK